MECGFAVAERWSRATSREAGQQRNNWILLNVHGIFADTEDHVWGLTDPDPFPTPTCPY
jgi:hypothetical protein